MKKYLLSVTLLLITAFVYPQFSKVVFHESFELPSLADSVTSSGTTTWGVSTKLAYKGLRSDSCVVPANDTVYLTTDSFNTLGNTYILLEFAHICKIEFFDRAAVEVSTNNGVTWTKLTTTQYLGTGTIFTSDNCFTSTSYNNDWLPTVNTAKPMASWWKTEQFDISSIAPNAKGVRIRFKLYDGAGGIPGANANYGWLIDNIKVTAAISELIPPVLTLTQPILEDSVYFLGPFDFNATISDASGIDTADLIWTLNGGQPDTVHMTNTTGNSYYAKIDTTPVSFKLGDTICYYVYVADGSVVHNSSREPASGCISFVLMSSPPPSNCDSIINVFPITENMDSFADGGTVCYSVCPLLHDWTNETNDDVDWSPHSGPTPHNNYSTGPSEDHTSGNGKYLYVESYSCYNKTANLTSPCIDITSLSKPTLLFWYHMYGSNMGELHVDIYYGGKWKEDIMPPVIGDQGDTWYKAEIDLTPYRSVTKIRFRAITGSYLRSNIAIDDIKIWEPPANDAGISSISEPTSPSSTGTKNVKVVLMNYGSANLTAVNIDWKVDGITQTTYNWSGILTPASSDTITIGNCNLTNGVTTIKAWTTNPNGQADGLTSNDTMYISIIACSGPIKGVYTIGGSNPDFITFADALFALQHCGIDSAIVFNVDSGTYNEQLLIKEINGSSATNTITFQSLSGDSTDVVITYTATSVNDNYVVRLDSNASYITFKGMTIIAEDNSSFSRVIEITNDANHNKFLNNIIQGRKINTSSTNNAVLFSENTQINDNVIKNNRILYGSRGISFDGFSQTNLSERNIIEGNIISRFSYYGIFAYEQNAMQITSNVIENDSSASGPYGIHIQYCDKSKIIKNKITISGSSACYGIYMQRCDGIPSDYFLIANNFINVSQTLFASTCSGIFNGYCAYNNMYYNSVNVTGASLNSLRAISLQSSASTMYGNINLKNNNFVNANGGYAIEVDANAVTAGYLKSSNYNNYYVTGTADIGVWGMNNISDLAAWQAATGYDANSVSVNPYFVSAKDLHIGKSIVGYSGNPITGITDDIDNELRDINNPSIGADEKSPVSVDAGTVKILYPLDVQAEGDSVNITVIVKNFGTDTIKTMNVAYILNGNPPVTQSWNDVLLYKETDTVTFPKIAIHSGNNELCTFTILNGDTNAFNDTLCKDYYGTPNLDMGIVALVIPDSGNCYTSSETVKIRIQNFGSKSINFAQNITTINVSVTGPNPTSFTPFSVNNGSLGVGATRDYTITMSYDMSATGIYTFYAYTSVAGDGNSSNDTMQPRVIDAYKIVDVFPFYENFETFAVGTPGTLANGWTMDPVTDSYRWQVNKGPTTTLATGPVYDHTLGNSSGIYMYTEASYDGSQAYLVTPCLDLTGMTKPQLKFWYHMCGQNIYTLRVDVNRNGVWTNSIGSIISQQQTSETDAWKHKVIDLSNYKGIVKLRFRAMRGTGEVGDIAIDDVYVYDPVAKDASAKFFTKPAILHSPVGTSQSVEITIENNGSDTLTSMNVGYIVNNSTPVIETWIGQLLANQSASYLFAATFKPTSGQFTVKAFTQLSGDAIRNNDTTYIEFTGVPVITVPWSDDMEGVNYWVSTDGFSQWQRGIPSASVIKTTHSPVNVWATDLDDNYLPNSNDNLYSPYFDFSAANDPKMDFWHWIHTYSGQAGGNVQYSVNGGATWVTLGYQGDTKGTNWYTNMMNGKYVWDGQYSSWINSTYDLTQFDNYSQIVQFRFNFSSGSGDNSTYNGWAVDDFKITVSPIPYDAGIIAITQPLAQTLGGATGVQVKVTIKNFGTNALTSIPVVYKITNGASVQGTWTGNLAPNATTDYTFTTTFTSPMAPYELCAFTNLTNDTYTYNDKTCKTISMTPMAVDAGVIKIEEPTNLTIVGNNISVKVLIKNFGTSPITSTSVSYKINGAGTVMETWTGTLAPGDTTDYTFTAPYISKTGMYNLCANTTLTGDVYSYNNEECKYVFGVVNVEELLDNGFVLGQNIPNPADNTTIIPYTLPLSGKVNFELINLLGEKVYGIEKTVPAGKQQIEINAADFPRGLYFYSVEFKGRRLVKKMVIN